MEGKEVKAGSFEMVEAVGAVKDGAGSAYLGFPVHSRTTCNGSMILPSCGPNPNIVSPSQLAHLLQWKCCLFDTVPAEKVHEIMRLVAATAIPGEIKNSGSYCPSPVLTRSTSMQNTATPLASPQPKLYPVRNNPLCRLQTDSLIARRHSSSRFLEKRRDRLVNKTPYASYSRSKSGEEKETIHSGVASPDSGCRNPPCATE